MTAPETIEAAVHENSKNAAQNTPLIWSPKLIAIAAPAGLPNSLAPHPSATKFIPDSPLIIDVPRPGPLMKAQ